MRDDAGRGILSSTFSGNPAATEDFFGLASTSVIVSSGEDEHLSPYSFSATLHHVYHRRPGNCSTRLAAHCYP